jgi:hypothetical protein
MQAFFGVLHRVSVKVHDQILDKQKKQIRALRVSSVDAFVYVIMQVALLSFFTEVRPVRFLFLNGGLFRLIFCACVILHCLV